MDIPVYWYRKVHRGKGIVQSVDQQIIHQTVWKQISKKPHISLSFVMKCLTTVAVAAAFSLYMFIYDCLCVRRRLPQKAC